MKLVCWFLFSNAKKSAVNNFLFPTEANFGFVLVIIQSYFGIKERPVNTEAVKHVLRHPFLSTHAGRLQSIEAVVSENIQKAVISAISIITRQKHRNSI